MASIISSRAKRVWQRLTEWYGARLAEQYGATPPEDWRDLVDRCDNDTIKRALARIRSTYLDFPPTFPQFSQAMALCSGAIGPAEPHPADRLSDYAMRHLKLTPRQIRLPWNYFGKEFDAPNLAGEMKKNYGAEVYGVSIPADGESPGHRLMLDDIQGFGP